MEIECLEQIGKIVHSMTKILIDSILGTRAATEPVALLESSSTIVPDVETIERNEPVQNEGV